MLSRNGVLSLVNEFTERYTGGLYKSCPPITVTWHLASATDTTPCGFVFVITDETLQVSESRSIPLIDLAACDTYDAILTYIDKTVALAIRSLQKHQVRS